MSIDFTEVFPDEVVTRALVRDIDLPEGAGTMALVTLDNGMDHTRPNTFGPQTLTLLGEVLDGVAARAAAGEIAAVGITGKPFILAAGADLSGVAKVTRREQGRAIAELGHRTFSKLTDMGVPTFAFMNGLALGGGVEVNLYCTYRTISSGVPALALPECFLGLLPGWGGTWLLPNLIGIERALKVVIENPLSMNKMLKGPQAFDLGIADALFEPADFLAQSLVWASQVLTGQVTVERAPVQRDESTWAAAIDTARSFVDMKTGGHSPAPYRALELLAASRTNTREEGFEAENEALADLIMSDELRAGLYAFDLVQKRAKRPAGAPDRTLSRKVTKVGVVGAGLMASQLALLFVRRLKVPVVITDLDAERVAKGVAYVHAELDKLVVKGRLSADKCNRFKALITGSTEKSDFADAEFVIEAVFEEMAVKKQVWREVEEVVGPECVLATNTSSLSVTEMAADLEHPDRVVGFHFFNPVAVMPLLEIVEGEKTDEATLATAFATGRALGKTTIRVKDSPSFIVNRLLGRFMSDMARIVDAGTPMEIADQGFSGVAPMPPFVLMGLVGPAIALHNNESLAKAFPERFYISENLRRVVKAGKSSYYTFGSSGMIVDPEILALYELPAEPVVLTAEEVREKVLAGLAEEARLMLDEGVVAAPMDIDLGMITGAGFQFWNGGLTPLLDRTGKAEQVTGARFLPRGAADVPA
ncbi:3-hydroxyacyl-CoA dehydrogenase / enoyl-CoA hydratase / 3-hydroxybutyryl-CoA epimerase [Austwickia chelonae]|uniref:Putative fatty acid oxidation complex alpha subunit n=1 Tax=Austwickia chelonae NBRC 105200 TaxID=1184607 RepID=K6VKN9_9MICO|nr:3-hydroxyacyl-CoA dehydrogenase NAD-binding domain-containing protein [Austwickia chelonae]GAB77304.1 putative fatty acid oxidation complex alpha subunit [Austwickia chelonae NBRC 105200]SEW07398.1 3-hydroxyacyl-CoA dehydrogenase / enoyl-CoA hydratase / 3-hydroxybutyryl-CoA epimerase [Austwickia chelonae]